MTGLWSLESSAQLFTQNLHTQHTQPKRAHRGNKVGSGADDMPAPWLQCASVWVCEAHECAGRFVWDVYIDLTKLISSSCSHSFCNVPVQTVSLLAYCKMWRTNICYESPWQCVCFIISNCELTTDTESSMQKPQMLRHTKTCTFVLHSLLRHIKLLQCSHDMVINLFLCRLLSVSHRGFKSFFLNPFLTTKASLTLKIFSCWECPGQDGKAE